MKGPPMRATYATERTVVVEMTESEAVGLIDWLGPRLDRREPDDRVGLMVYGVVGNLVRGYK